MIYMFISFIVLHIKFKYQIKNIFFDLVFIGMRNHRLICLDDNFLIDYSSVLGQGATGKVFQGYNNKNGLSVAIKVIQIQSINTQVMNYLYQMEVNALRVLNNRFVIKCLGIIQRHSHSFLISEYYNGLTLANQIKQKGALGQQRSLELLQCILKGYEQILHNKILHRDMKTDNIMLHNGIPKIIDFGYCQVQGFLKPKKSYNVGSPSYMAPQSHNNNIYNEKTQIWAIGAIFYECLTGRALHKGQNNMIDAYNKLKNNGLTLPQGISQNSIKILYQCFNFDPNKRPTVKNLLHFVAQLRKFQKIEIPSISKNVRQINSINMEHSHDLNGKLGNNRSQIPIPNFLFRNNNQKNCTPLESFQPEKQQLTPLKNTKRIILTEQNKNTDYFQKKLIKTSLNTPSHKNILSHLSPNNKLSSSTDLRSTLNYPLVKKNTGRSSQNSVDLSYRHEVIR